jgi:hypothetical protein
LLRRAAGPTIADMKLEFQCPWCGCETSMSGPDSGSWRFRLPCELCERDMIVTWDAGLVVGRAAEPMARSDEDTVRIRLARAG